MHNLLIIKLLLKKCVGIIANYQQTIFAQQHLLAHG